MFVAQGTDVAAPSQSASGGEQSINTFPDFHVSLCELLIVCMCCAVQESVIVSPDLDDLYDIDL